MLWWTLRQLKSKNAYTRFRAAVKLRESKDVRAIEALIATLKDYSADVRDGAIHSLGELGDVRAVEPLIQALSDEARHVRRAAAIALRKIGDVRAVEPLIAALKGKDGEKKIHGEEWRVEVVDALGQIGDAQAIVPTLLEALVDHDSSVSNRAGTILKRITPNWEKSEVAARAVLIFVEALKNSDSGVRERAVQALGRVGGTQAVEALVKMLNDRDSSVKKVVVATLNSLGFSPRNDRERYLLQGTPSRMTQPVSLASILNDKKIFELGDEYAAQRIVDCILRVPPTLNAEDSRTLRMVENAISVLQDLLGRSAAKIRTEVLYAMLSIPKIGGNEEYYPYDSTHPAIRWREVDPSKVRRLAEEELARRGLNI